MRLSTLLLLAAIFAVGWVWGDTIVPFMIDFFSGSYDAFRDKLADI